MRNKKIDPNDDKCVYNILLVFLTDSQSVWIYAVTTVYMAHVAMSMLSKEKKKFDMMIINVHSPDSFCFKLLKQVVALDIVTLCKYLFYL